MPTVTKSDKTVAPFGIEADHPRNCDISIKCIPNCKLRGSIKSSIELIESQKERMKRRAEPDDVLTAPAHAMGLPRVPGMQLHVNPEKGTYRIVDPLYENETMCERIRRALNTAPNSPYQIDKLEGVPPQTGTIDDEDMVKTLVREMVGIINAGEARLCKGSLPTTEEIDGMPGDYLLSPGVEVDYNQPRYEKDVPAWRKELSRMGG